MKVVILCGGMGTRLREETEYKPKPLVEIGGKPILWHIMKSYAHYGFREFVLCLGYKGEMIKDYFFNYELRNNDVTVSLGHKKSLEFHNTHPEEGWKVTLAETGKTSMTGARIKRIAKYLGWEPFLLTYGDGLADVNIGELVRFHRSHGRIGTVTGVYLPSRFGHVVAEGNRVLKFNEKPISLENTINGGFFVFEPEFLDYVNEDEQCVLEAQPLEALAAEGELQVFPHRGFWQCMDTFRDFELLNKAWDSGDAPWRTWAEAKVTCS